MYQKFYSEFLKGHEGKIHMAAHSHHFWPDVSLKGHMEFWQDSALMSDGKWGSKIFSEVLPEVQNLICEMTKFSRPKDIAFAPNTHELVFRLISTFLEKPNKPFKILTTDSEFHSLERQLCRLEESKLASVKRIAANAPSFEEGFLKEAKNDYDLIIFSHVFFNSGKALSTGFIKNVILASSKETLLCVDGYHAFAALPVDLSEVGSRIFYVAGGYKYAQAGEGLCFLTLPENCKLRPVNTGWFANFGALENKKEGAVEYDNDGLRFGGATYDPSAAYRFKAVWSGFKKAGISVSTIHSHVQKLQKLLIDSVENKNLFLNTDLNKQGHFLCISFKSKQEAKSYSEFLKSKNILTDYRENILRFGIGLYHTEKEVHEVAKALIIHI